MSNELKKPTVFTEIATKCDFCDFSTKDPKAMERHIKIRQRDSETQCDKCPMKFCTVGSMMFHATEKHTRQKISEYKCEKCHFVSGKADELYRHQQNAKVFSGGPHLCSDCTFKSCTKFDLNTHLSKHHGKDINAQAPVQKVQFQKPVGHVQPPVQHVQTVQAVEDPLLVMVDSGNVTPNAFVTCELCGWKSLNMNEMDGHKEVVHGLRRLPVATPVTPAISATSATPIPIQHDASSASSGKFIFSV